MIRSPLFFGEIIHLSRAPRTWALRAGLAVFLTAAAALAWPWSGSVLKLHDAGTAIFQVFFWTEFVAGVFLVPAMVAPSIAWERENGTLDLLSVAPVTDLEIVSGKLLANGALVAATLGAGLPFGVAALVLGGTTPEILLTTTIGLVLHGFFAASISILMSASSDRAGAATGLAIVTLFVFGIVSLMLGGFGQGILGGILRTGSAAPSGSVRAAIPGHVFALLCPWSATFRDAFSVVSGHSVSWSERGVAWTMHLLESAGALVLAGMVLRHKRSPRSGAGAVLPVPAAGPRIPMAILAPQVAFVRPAVFTPPAAPPLPMPALPPVATASPPPEAPAPSPVPVPQAVPVTAIPLASVPMATALPQLRQFAPFAPVTYRNVRLPVRGNPIYWKDRIFDDSPARQVLVVLGAAACGLAFFVDALAWLINRTMHSAGAPSSAAESHVALLFDLAVAIVLAVGAGAATLGPERRQGTLPILISTGMPARDILRGKLLAAIRSIAPVLVVAGAHLIFVSLTMGAAGFLAALAFVLGLATAFAVACALSLAAGHPRRAAVLTAGVLFALWAVPALFALPFPGHAAFLTSIDPFGLFLRAVSMASSRHAEPDTAGTIVFLLASPAISVAALAASAAALESRVRA